MPSAFSCHMNLKSLKIRAIGFCNSLFILHNVEMVVGFHIENVLLSSHTLNTIFCNTFSLFYKFSDIKKTIYRTNGFHAGGNQIIVEKYGLVSETFHNDLTPIIC